MTKSAALGGSITSWPTGLVATVTFEEGTNLDELRIADTSINTYVILLAGPDHCHGTTDTTATDPSCATMRPKLEVVVADVAQPVRRNVEPVVYSQPAERKVDPLVYSQPVGGEVEPPKVALPNVEVAP